MVLDHITGLMWQDDSETTTVTKPWLTATSYNAGNYFDTSGDTATTYCANLTLGGYSDWRLPTLKELLFIVDNSKSNPSINSQFQNTMQVDYYWSSTTRASDTSKAWTVIFAIGNAKHNLKTWNLFMRCVRVGQ